MQCTSCKTGSLISGTIEHLFNAHTCNHCGGNWILIEDFLSWKDRNPEYQFAENIHCEEGAEESLKALLCPVTGSLMSKFKISSNTQHRIDYSASIGGIWLDKGEWELLKKEGIAGHINNLVTRSWQNKVRAATTKENFIAIYETKFGKESYAKAKQIREWLQNQPQKVDLGAYLLADDPYSTH